MRKLGGALAVLLLVALAIFVIGELTETDEDADEPSPTVPGATAPSTTPAPEPEPGQNGGSEGDEQTDAAIERAVFVYLERAERGEVDVVGLPTSDEASIGRLSLSSPAGTAVAFLVGGARLELERRGRRWVVTRAVPARVEPQPPSGPP